MKKKFSNTKFLAWDFLSFAALAPTVAPQNILDVVLFMRTISLGPPSTPRNFPVTKIHSSPEKNPRQMESREKKSNNTDYLPLGARTVKTRFNVCCAQNRETFEDLHGLRQLYSISQHGLIRVNGYRISPPYLRWHPSANPHSTAVTYCVRMIRRNL